MVQYQYQIYNRKHITRGIQAETVTLKTAEGGYLGKHPSSSESMILG